MQSKINLRLHFQTMPRVKVDNIQMQISGQDNLQTDGADTRTLVQVLFIDRNGTTFKLKHFKGGARSVLLAQTEGLELTAVSAVSSSGPFRFLACRAGSSKNAD